MNRISPNVDEEYRFNGVAERPASDFFTPASEIAAKSNYDAREVAQLVACVAVEEVDRR